MSQQAFASHKMDRAGSNLSVRSDGPFMINGPVSPPPKVRNVNQQQSNIGIMEYWDKDGPPNSTYPFTRSMPQRQDMPPVPESAPSTGVMMDPAAYLATLPIDEESLGMPSYNIPAHAQPCDLDIPRFNVTDPSTCGSMTSGQSYDTNQMSRQNSQFDNQSVSGGVQMMTLGSQMSHGGDDMGYRDGFGHPSSGDNSPLGKRPFSNDEALFAVGASLSPPYPHQYAGSAANEALVVSPEMERSVSNTSIASNRSTSSLNARAKDTLKQQVHRGLNAPLKPKPAVDPSAGDSNANAKKDGKAAIVKTKYVRPKQPKVFCDQCDEHKDGFRGEHELRRHKDAKHQDMVKKFICVDPEMVGLPVGVRAVNPLNRCKACKGHKKYGAYYNAAAHLRRTHFKEKPSRQKNKGTNNARGEDDRRGGKGGGDWPPMSELKNWMQEIWVNKHDSNLGEDDEGDDDSNPTVTAVNMGMNLAGMGGFTTSEPQAETGSIEYMAYPPNNLVINTDVAYMSGMPISSAGFEFATSPNVSSAFAPEYATYGSQEQPNHYVSSAVSPAFIETRLEEVEPAHMYAS